MIARQDFAPADTARVVALVTACSQAAYAFAPAAFGLLRDLTTATGAAGAAPALFLAAAAAVLVMSRRPEGRAEPAWA